MRPQGILKYIIYGGACGFLSLWLSIPAMAQELPYDPYAPVYEKEPKAPSALSNALVHFLIFPLEIVRWPIDKTLLFIEENHLEKKAQWIYDTLQSEGITPHASIVSAGQMGGGATVDMIRVMRQKENFPDATLKGWFKWINGVRRVGGGQLGWQRIGGTGFRNMNTMEYENRPEEFFFGIGPDSSPGDGAIFAMETTKIETSWGYSVDPTFGLDIQFAYENINISGGRDGGRGQRGEIPSFSFDSTPGIRGDSILRVGAELVRDTRNQKENSNKGSRQKLALSYHEGLNSSEARFLRYQAETAHYFQLGSERRVFVLRAMAEHNDELGSGNVPFHQMAKLGGFGRGNRISDTLRGFDNNRFFDESAILFNVEYRYTIWEYRELKMDAVVFLDEGNVFAELSDFEFDDFKEGYGVGFRGSIANVPVLSIELAHSDEGTKFYFKTRAPF